MVYVRKISKKKNNYKKISRYKKKRQTGGDIVLFQVYFFSNIPISDNIKDSIKQCLINLYGLAVTNIDEDNEWHTACKVTIQNFILEKGDKYRNKNEIFGLNIQIPLELKGEMDDGKLTVQEGKINKALKRMGISFRLFPDPPGIWNKELAIIAFENY